MQKAYDKLVKIVEEIGIKSTLEKKNVKVIDLENSILVLEPSTGWLAIRKELKDKLLSGEIKRTQFNDVLYHKKSDPDCELGQLKKLLKEVRKY